MWLLRGRLRTSDVLIVVVALIAATVATVLITRADQRMDRGGQAERLLEEIAESENELYDLSVELLSGDAQADDVRRVDADGMLQVAEIESLDADLRELLAAVPPADRHFRQHVNVGLSLVAASSHAAEYHRSYVVPAHQAATSTVTETYALLEERNQTQRHRVSETSIAAALLAILVTALGVLLLNRTKRARAEAEGVALASENQQLRDQTAVAELVVRVAHAADSTDSVERLLERTLGQVCVHAGWPIGHLWLRSSDGGLEPSGIGTARSRVASRCSARRLPSSGAPLRTRCPDAPPRPVSRSGSTTSAAKLCPAPLPHVPKDSRPRLRSRSSPPVR